MAPTDKTAAFRSHEAARMELINFLATPVGKALMDILESMTKVPPAIGHDDKTDPSVARAYAYERLAGRTEVIERIRILQFGPNANTAGDPKPFQSPQLNDLHSEFAKAQAALKKNPAPAGIV